MQAPFVVAHTKILFSLIAGAGLGAIAYLDLSQNEALIALITASLSFIMVLNGLYLLIRRGQNTSSYLEWLFIILLASFSVLAAGHQGQLAIHWVYFFPLAAFFLFSLNVGIMLVLLYVPLALFVVFYFGFALVKFQVLFTYAAISLVAFFLAVIKERTNIMLEPLISNDILTGALQYERLHPSLKTEIIRAEREGTGLLLMLLETSKVLQPLKQDHKQRYLKQAADCITENLRPFDSFYRMPNNDFAVILPHTTTQDAKSVAQNMLIHFPKQLNPQSIKVGLASLNVGDDADSLVDIASNSMEPLHA